jgi:ATPase
VLDTSIIIDGEVSKMLDSGQITSGDELVVPIAALDELQSQASTSKEHGMVGLVEIKRIREQCLSKNINLRFSGTRPKLDEIRLAKHGRIDSIIKDVALEENAILVTADYVQSLVAEAQGIKCKYVRQPRVSKPLEFEKYFDEKTMSIHLKEGTCPLAKRGVPGNLELVKLCDKKMTYQELSRLVKEISDESRIADVGSLEISRIGATVIQLGKYRIAITRTPFSDGLEITVVKPIAKLTLEDYGLSEKLIARLSERAEGIIIAGPPGSGKSTLASSLAEFYVSKENIVKTLESPRDLQVGDEVTQYAPLEGSFENAVDILLLVRPDYTIFDEIRRYRDFQVFADMKLAGVGMIGVVHASSPLDAVQRFIGKVELGMIPQILDTIIFMNGGMVKKVYEIKLTVKVPHGMTEADLARPLVEVRDFESSEVEYEIYTYGEENIVVPIKELSDKQQNRSAIKRLAEEKIRDVVRRFDPNTEIIIISEGRIKLRVHKDVIPRIIGKGGSTITELEELLGIKIDVEMKTPALGNEISFNINESGASIVFILDSKVLGKNVDIYIEDDYVCSNQVGKKSRIKIDKRSDNGRKLLNALLVGQKIKIFQNLNS